MKTVDRLRSAPPKTSADLAHGNSGKRPCNALREAVEIEAVAALRMPEYEGLGPTMAQEILEDYHGIVLSKETARKIMRRNGLWKAGKVKKRSLHLLRPPRPRRGELVQGDGCLHNWFGEGKCCLMIFVDDATSELLAGRFEPFECGIGYARWPRSSTGIRSSGARRRLVNGLRLSKPHSPPCYRGWGRR